MALETERIKRIRRSHVIGAIAAFRKDWDSRIVGEYKL